MTREKPHESGRKRRNTEKIYKPTNNDYLIKFSEQTLNRFSRNNRSSENEDIPSYPERLRLASESQKTNYESFFLFLKKITKPIRNIDSQQILSFFFLIIFSVFFNSLYFNYFYFPTINENRSNQPERHKFYSNQNFLGKNLEYVAFPSMKHDSYYDESKESQYSLVSKEEAVNAYNNQLLLEIQEKKKEELLKKEKKKHEAKMALSLALNMQKEGKIKKAAKIYSYALSLDPKNTDALISYGEYLEIYKNDIIKAEHFYTKAKNMQPDNNKAILNLNRASPLVNQLDRLMLNKLDSLLQKFYEIPATNAALKRAKRDAYFMHIYHSNAIEGNTLNLHQTRHILENRLAINDKSLIEHQEVLGLDAAMRYINKTLLNRNMHVLSLQEILEIHKRVLGFVDPIEAGKFRQHQVYVGNFVPPSADQVEDLMIEFINWINSNQLLREAHPIQIAALVHYKFVYIHPFYDGNGRTARLLMNLILMKLGYPPVIIKKEDRFDYYEYLEMANEGDVKPFIRFIARCVKKTLEEYIMISNNSGMKIENIKKVTINDKLLDNQYGDDYIYDGLSLYQADTTKIDTNRYL